MDIDIDLRSDFKVEKYFDVTQASMVENKELKKHLVGAYFQNIPVDSFTKLSAIPYKQAEEFGYFKIDFLHLNLLNTFESKDEIKEILKRKINWKLFQDKSIVSRLFHLANSFDIVDKVKPNSILELADILALIRPNKRLLLDKYLRNRVEVRKALYQKNDPSDLRKAHAIAYALNVVLQLHLIEGNIL